MAFSNVWDDNFPPDTQLANLLGQDLRNFRLDTQQRMAAISGLDASKPNFGGDAQPNNWNGILFFATDTGKIYQWTNPVWTNVTSNFNLTSSVKKFSTVGSNTNGAGQTVFTMSVPAAAMGVGSILEFHFGTNGSSTLNVSVGGSLYAFYSQPATNTVWGFFTSLTAFTLIDTVGNSIPNIVVSNINTTPFVILGTQRVAGAITTIGAWATVIP